MTVVFLKLFNMSIAAGWLVLAAVLFRRVFKNAPKRFRCIVWAMVALRLVLPFTIESPLSITPRVGEIPEEVITAASAEAPRFVPDAQTPYELQEVYRPISNSFNTISNYGEGRSDGSPSASAVVKYTGVRSKADAFAYIWLGGVLAMTFYFIASFIQLRIKMSVSSPLYDNIIICDGAATPFILGAIRPKIVLPSSISEEDARYAIAHEKAHIKRCDHLIKPFAFLLLSVYWFNPLVWVAYVLLSRDIELACDERVIKNGGAELKKGYSAALLNCSGIDRRIAACPVAFGGLDVKERVKSVLSYKRATFSAIVAALLCCLAIAVFLLPAAARKAEADDAATHEASFFQEDEEVFIPEEVTRSLLDDTYSITFELNNHWTTGASATVELNSTEHAFVITVTDKNGRTNTDRGSYTEQGSQKLCMLSENSGIAYDFGFYDGWLVFEGENGTGVFGDCISKDSGFKITRANSADCTYVCMNNNSYLLRKNADLLYVFGDPTAVSSAIVNDPYFAGSPELLASVTEALTDLGHSRVGCRFRLSGKSALLDSATDRYDSYMLAFSLIFNGSAEGNVSVSINGRMIAYSVDPSVNRMTPGSLFVKGGKPYGY